MRLTRRRRTAPRPRLTRGGLGLSEDAPWSRCCSSWPISPRLFNTPVHFTYLLADTFSVFLYIHASQTVFGLGFPSTFRGKPCRADRSCFDSLCAKLRSVPSHGFIHKISSKPEALSDPRQLSVYSNRGEKGECVFSSRLCYFYSPVPFRRRDDKTCKTLIRLHREWVIKGWRALTHLENI